MSLNGADPVALSHPPVGLGWVQAVWLSLAAGSCTRQLWRPVRDEIVAGVLCIYGDAMVIRRAPDFRRAVLGLASLAARTVLLTLREILCRKGYCAGIRG